MKRTLVINGASRESHVCGTNPPCGCPTGNAAADAVAAFRRMSPEQQAEVIAALQTAREPLGVVTNGDGVSVMPTESRNLLDNVSSWMGLGPTGAVRAGRFDGVNPYQWQGGTQDGFGQPGAPNRGNDSYDATPSPGPFKDKGPMGPATSVSQVSRDGSYRIAESLEAMWESIQEESNSYGPDRTHSQTSRGSAASASKGMLTANSVLAGDDLDRFLGQLPDRLTTNQALDIPAGQLGIVTENMRTSMADIEAEDGVAELYALRGQRECRGR